MLNSRFGYSMKKNSFKGLNIDCIQYSNIIRITYYSYSYSGTILNPNIIRIRIRPNICARILFVFVFAHSEKTNIIRIRIRSKFWFRILFVFVFGPKNSICSPLVYLNTCFAITCHVLKLILFYLWPCILQPVQSVNSHFKNTGWTFQDHRIDDAALNIHPPLFYEHSSHY